MTYSAELAKRHQRLEYILCIEGMGWTVSPNSTADGFIGDVFVTTDMVGTLQDDLAGDGDGPALHKGLMVRGSFSETLNTREVSSDFGGMDFEIIDDGSDFLLGSFAPHRTGLTSILDTELTYGSTTVVIVDDIADEGDTVHLGRREAVLLGSKSGAGPYTYTGCTRNYLGTPRGRLDANNQGGRGLSWTVDGAYTQDTSVSLINRNWSDRMMRLYAHVPGEDAEECFLVWQGRLKRAQNDQAGVVWKFSGTGDPLGRINKMRRCMPFTLVSNSFHLKEGAQRSANSGLEEGGATVHQDAYQDFERYMEIYPASAAQGQEFGFVPNGARLIRALYQYRTEPGGTEGIDDGGDVTDGLQALNRDGFDDIAYSLVNIGGNLVRLLRRASTEYPIFYFIAEVTADWAGQWSLSLYENGAQGFWLLDNFTDDPGLSRFAIDGIVRRNPIDFALMVLTSFHDEFAEYTADTGSTESLILTGVTQVDDFWDGYTLHCVSGDNKGFARKIIATGTASGDVEGIEVEPFPNSVTAGDVFQVRNSAYDVLPLTWGMCKHHTEIDIEAFEEVRDKYLKDVSLGKFAIGSQFAVNMLDMLQECVFKPYGLLMYMDRSSHKLSLKYVGDPLGNEVDGTYIPITKSQIYRVGTMDYSLAKPVGKISLSVRDKVDSVVGVVQGTSANYRAGEFINKEVVGADPTNAQALTVEIVAPEIEGAYYRDDLDTVEVKAMLHTVDDMHPLIPFLVARVARYSTPPPVIPLEVDVELFTQLHIGAYVSLTYEDAPTNPFTGQRGWNGLIARVVGIGLPLSASPTLSINVEMLSELNGALLAPSGVVVSATTGLAGNVTIEPDAFVQDPDNDNDLFKFAVGDAVEARNPDGSLIGAMGNITSFGANTASTPEAADTNRINVDGTVPAVAAGDIVGFATYQDAHQASQRRRVALADANEVIGTDDPAKEFS